MRWLNLRRARTIWQVVSLAVFVFLLAMCGRGAVDRYPVELFLDMSPLSAVTTIVSSGTLATGMLAAAIVVATTFFFGRWFCGWVCPMGTCHDVASRFMEATDRRTRYQRHTYSMMQRTKYGVLAVTVVSAAFGVVLAGWFDPIALLTRFVSTVVWPMNELCAAPNTIQSVAFGGIFLTSMLVIGAVAMNRVWPRFWCQWICPLGAILSICAVKPVFRVVRDPRVCVDCGKCRLSCAGNCNVDTRLVGSECVMCMNCLEACPVGAISYSVAEPMPLLTVERRRGVDVSRRQFFTSLLAGLATVATLRNSKHVMGRGYELRVRPPGTLAESDFLARCIRCGECMRACPTNVIQPASTQVDAEAQFTPVMDFEAGYCDVDCVRCSQVCPTGAIRPITTKQKNEDGFAKIGTAFVDRNRCLPWSFGQTCLVCQEVCPVSPKAIVFQHRRFDDSDGKSVRLEMPYVKADACTGCGACQLNCPVQDQPAIRVTSIGEHRHPDRKLTL